MQQSVYLTHVFFLFLGGPRAYLPNIEMGGQGVGKKPDITFADACGILKINLDQFWVTGNARYVHLGWAHTAATQ